VTVRTVQRANSGQGPVTAERAAFDSPELVKPNLSISFGRDSNAKPRFGAQVP